MELINQAFHPFLNQFVTTLIDNILVYLKNEIEHEIHLS